MPLRPTLFLLALAAPLLLGTACTHDRRELETPMVHAPEAIADLDDFRDARNAYALLALDDPERPVLRARLRDYLIGYVDEALAEGNEEAAVDALERLVELWTPAELRKPKADPELATSAREVYDAVAAVGDEDPAMLCLGIEQVFGDESARARAERDYAELEDWLERTREFSPNPMAGGLDRVLETVTATFPSPFLTSKLAATYLNRYRAAQDRQGLSTREDPRIRYTAYLVARAYLRADDFATPVAMMDRLQMDAPTQALRDLLAELAKGELRSPTNLDQLIVEFVPTPASDLPADILTQSWGIVDNLARRALDRFPDHPPAHLARARVLRARGLADAAIVHYERAFAGKTRATHHEDLARAWSELAEQYQLALVHRLETKLEEGEAMLERVEAFHKRAAEVWDQPIEPGLPLSWMTVAMFQFDAGHVAEAERLLAKSVDVEPHPAALSLLGTIAVRRGDFDEARGRLRELESLPFADQLDRYDWQIKSQMQLAELEALAGHRDATVEHLRDALGQLNTLLSYPGLSDSLRVEFLGRRALVFFFLDEIELAMADFHSAEVIDLQHGSLVSDALMFTVVHGQLDQAREIFSASLESDESDEELNLYYALWVFDLGIRVAGTPPPEARDYLRSFAEREGSDPWLRKLARHGLGELEFESLDAAAKLPRQRSEALFYEGLQRWRDGSHDAGLSLMRKVIEAEIMGDFEYQMAQSYLSWNELPRTARAATDSP